LPHPGKLLEPAKCWVQVAADLNGGGTIPLCNARQTSLR